MTILALTLIVWSGIETPTPAVEAPPQRHVHDSRQSVPRLTPRERDWLEHAIDQILRGD